MQILPLSTVIGRLSSMIGTLIRESCYRALGNLFTYEVTIRPEHRLVNSGPYRIVRHPGYSGVILHLPGAILMVLGPNSYPRTCGLMSSSIFVRSLVWAWAVYVSFIVYTLLRRGPVEDRELHKRFGKIWEEYARRVPYMYIPGII